MKKNKGLETNSVKFITWIFVIFVVAILVIIIVSGVYFFHFNDGFSRNPNAWGTFGDFIGGTLNPILSFLSLIALLLTIVLQQRELEYTREELIRSVDAQEATKKIMGEQSVTLERQQFESTFFSLLDQHNKILDSLFVKSNGGHYQLEAIRVAACMRDTDLDSARSLLEKNKDICGNYFRVLYQLLKFIKTNTPDTPIDSVWQICETKTAIQSIYLNFQHKRLSISLGQTFPVFLK